jgi:hypothetical protein
MNSPSWQNRIMQARKVGRFTPEDKRLCGNWPTCRVGEIAQTASRPEAIINGVDNAFAQCSAPWSFDVTLDAVKALPIARAYEAEDQSLMSLAVLGYAFNNSVALDNIADAQVLHDAMGNVL